MAKQITGKIVAKNMVLSVSVQAVSVLIGFIMNLIVPKFIDEYQYSYWQTFLLYAQYVGILHFGLMDGIVLRYSQYDYEELDKKSVRSQYIAIMFIDVFFAIGMAVAAYVFLQEVMRVICIMLAITIFIKITNVYVSFTFQTTNRIEKYALLVALHRCSYCALVLLCLILNLKRYYYFCMADIIAELIGIVSVGLRYSGGLFWGKLMPKNELMPELKKTLTAGIWLMVASYSAILLVGFGKMVIQWHWDALVFGKVSLAYSLTSFFLQFITAISIVLFPSIKRIDQNKLPEMYKAVRDVISPLLMLVLVFYYPGSLILEMWLPKYASSIMYLGILLPIIVFMSKVSLLTNNYLKAYRKERQILVINATVVAVSFAVFMVMAYVFSNLTALLVSLVFAIMIRSIVSEIAVVKIIHVRVGRDVVLETLMTIVFIASVIFFKRMEACMVYCLALLFYFAVKRKDVFEIFYALRSMVRKRG